MQVAAFFVPASVAPEGRSARLIGLRYARDYPKELFLLS